MIFWSRSLPNLLPKLSVSPKLLIMLRCYTVFAPYVLVRLQYARTLNVLNQNSPWRSSSTWKARSQNLHAQLSHIGRCLTGRLPSPPKRYEEVAFTFQNAIPLSSKLFWLVLHFGKDFLAKPRHQQHFGMIIRSLAEELMAKPQFHVTNCLFLSFTCCWAWHFFASSPQSCQAKSSIMSPEGNCVRSHGTLIWTLCAQLYEVSAHSQAWQFLSSTPMRVSCHVYLQYKADVSLLLGHLR